LNFLVIGDWGRNGFYNQSLVASQMGRVGELLDIDFVISVGDNFYNTGLTGVKDPKFTTSFSRIYTAPSLQKPWYTILGNHDYMGDALAQLDPAMTQRDSRWYCRREFELRRSLSCESSVDLFFIDTTPFIDEYWMPNATQTFDWRGLAPRQEQLRSQVEASDAAFTLLASSRATWKIVVGHHTMHSFGRHGDSVELLDQILPVLEAHDVDAYINGHDHCLEHIKHSDSKITFITSGAGSKSWQGIRPATVANGLHFAYDGQGFVSASVGRSSFLLEFYDAFGNVLHTTHLRK
ncbi:hypothetical protein SELMODRAFT_132000, partial [Selaginella moellendorffii]